MLINFWNFLYSKTDFAFDFMNIDKYREKINMLLLYCIYIHNFNRLNNASCKNVDIGNWLFKYAYIHNKNIFVINSDK